MLDYIPDYPIQLALKTWYLPDNPEHFKARHPAMGLLGEIAETLNYIKKVKYKPGIEFNREYFLEEMGDSSYYVRILAYQCQETFESIHKLVEYRYNSEKITIEYALMRMTFHAASILSRILTPYDCNCKIDEVDAEFVVDDLAKIVGWIEVLITQQNYTFDEMFTDNYQKLNKPGNKMNGWEDAR